MQPAVWLKNVIPSNQLKDAESRLDKDIFKNSPTKKKKSKKVTEAREAPELRPTTAKRRENRPSSAERNRNGAVQPSVWLENMSRESKTGARSFIECTPAGQKPERPSSADRKRDRKEQKKKNKKKTAGDDRPSSAERNRNDKINGAVWLEGQNRAKDNNGEERPSSAGKRRSRADGNNDNKQLDQNGKPMPNLAPLRGTPLKPILRPGKAAEI